MSNYWFLTILLVIPIGIAFQWISDSSKDFSDIIALELKKHGLKYVGSSYPGLFKVGPFKKFEITIGKPTINEGAIRYDNTYYRIVEFKTKTNRTKQVWAKIDTNWFKDTTIEFKPRLSKFKK
ncbi:MAG: hypothetical protein Mars2KO_18770 [Maribacter sp.]